MKIFNERGCSKAPAELTLPICQAPSGPEIHHLLTRAKPPSETCADDDPRIRSRRPKAQRTKAHYIDSIKRIL